MSFEELVSDLDLGKPVHLWKIVSYVSECDVELQTSCCRGDKDRGSWVVGPVGVHVSTVTQVGRCASLNC
jgi:hypothetical protein